MSALKQYTPPTFGSFGKTSTLQTWDKDSLDHVLKQVHRSRTPEQVAFDSAIVFSEGKQARGVVNAAFQKRGFAFGLALHTDASKASSLSVKKKNILPKQLAGLNASLTVATSDKDLPAQPKYGFYATTAFDYARPNFAATASVTTDEATNHALNASAAVGYDGFALGGDVKLVKSAGKDGKDAPLDVKAYNAGFVYSQGAYTGAVVSDAKFDKLRATLLASRLGATQAWNLAAQFKADVKAPSKGELVLGVDEVASDMTNYRLAAVVTGDNRGTFGASVVHRLRQPNVLLDVGLTTKLPGSTYAPWPVPKFGVSLTVGDY